MVKTGKIALYRETLDKTLACDNLANEKKLHALVKDQILRSSEGKIRDNVDNVVEKRTAEVSNFLDMLRSASENYGAPDKGHHASWKLKQDTEEFRVMYREGPVGSPFHSLLVEGYIEAPLDVCLCVSWETSLYPRWFPETLIPTFKVVAAKSLQKVMVGEQISLVRMKLSWPLSSREAILHYFELEYLEDDLVVVLINTITDVDNIQMETHGFTNEGIPDAGNTVRIDLVGGFALQRVTESRSYFRTIGNMDIKMDFVPPSLINFISRQLIGSGFRFYQKTVASVSRGDEAFSKVLSAPLYNRIREASLSKSEAKSRLETQNTQECTTASSGKEKKDVHDVSRKDSVKVLSSGNANKSMDKSEQTSNEIQEEESQERNNKKRENLLSDMFKVEDQSVLSSDHVNGHLLPYKPATEIEEEGIKGSENVMENGKVKNDKSKQEGSKSADLHQLVNLHQNLPISPQVEKALGTLDKMISVVREGRLKAHTSGQPGSLIEEGEATLSTTGMHVHPTNQQGVSMEQLVKATTFASTSGIALNGLRSMNPDIHAQETSSDVKPPVQNPPIGSWSRNAVSAGNSPLVDSSLNLEVNSIHDNNKKTGQPRKWRLCCLHLVSGWSHDMERKNNIRGDVH